MSSILLVSYFYPPAREVAVRRPEAMARQLRGRGHAVTVLTTSAYGTAEGEVERDVVRSYDLQLLQARLRGRDRALATFDSASTAEEPHLISRLVVPDAHRLAWTPFAKREAKRLARRTHFDCVITTSPPESAHQVGRALQRKGVAWLADLRDGWSFETMKDRIWVSPAQHRYSERMERRLLTEADAITTVTPPMLDDLRTRLGLEVRLVPNGWDPDAEVDMEAGRKLLDADRASIVFTGQLGPARRDPAPLIDALAQLARDDPQAAARIELAFAGSFTEREQELFATDVGPAVIRTLGTHPPAVVAGLQRSAEAALIITGPRRQEASMKLSEYIGAGVSILAIAHPDTAAAQIVSAGDAGIAVDPADQPAIVDALRMVAAGELPRASDQMRREWSWPGLGEKMAEAVEAAIASRRAG